MKCEKGEEIRRETCIKCTLYDECTERPPSAGVVGFPVLMFLLSVFSYLIWSVIWIL